MKGQYTNAEMEAKFDRFDHKRNYAEKLATVRAGQTINYYVQHIDGTWTNMDCRTVR